MRSHTKPNGASAAALAALSVLAILAVALPGCGGGEVAEEDADRVVPVAVSTVETGTVTPVLEYSGTIEGLREASVGAAMSGRVETFRVEAGDRVGAGDVLVEMAAERLTQAEAQFVAAEKDWERMKRLLEKGAVTEQAFDQVDAAHEAAKASYELVLESTRIRAPFPGVVSATYMEEGEVFILMPGGAATTPALVELVQMDTVKVAVAVPERDFLEVGKGLPAERSVSSQPGRGFRGEVSLVEPVLRTGSRTATAEISVPNPDEALRPGMFAHVTLELSPRETLLIPHDAVVQQEGTASYYAMVAQDGRARRVDIELGALFGESYELLGGLEEGTTVITAGRYRLPDGAAIRVRDEEGGR